MDIKFKPPIITKNIIKKDSEGNIQYRLSAEELLEEYVPVIIQVYDRKPVKAYVKYCEIPIICNGIEINEDGLIENASLTVYDYSEKIVTDTPFKN